MGVLLQQLGFPTCRGEATYLDGLAPQRPFVPVVVVVDVLLDDVQHRFRRRIRKRWYRRRRCLKVPCQSTQTYAALLGCEIMGALCA